MGLDGRWSAIRITLESQLIGLALILVGTARAWEDVDTGNALANVFVVGIAGLFVALLALEFAMVARERAGRPPARAAATVSSRHDRLPVRDDLVPRRAGLPVSGYPNVNEYAPGPDSRNVI
jgi:hypothetical protein